MDLMQEKIVSVLNSKAEGTEFDAFVVLEESNQLVITSKDGKMVFYKF
jgi:hypothetical protein